MKMSSRWLLLSDTLLNPLSLHVPSPCVCCTGVAAGLQDSQLHSGRPREGRELHRLLQRRGQALPHIGGRRPPGEDLGLSGNRTDCVLDRTATSIHLILIKSFFFYLIFHIISNLQSTPTCLITADSVWECHPYVFISLKEHCTVPGRKGNRKHTGTLHWTNANSQLTHKDLCFSETYLTLPITGFISKPSTHWSLLSANRFSEKTAVDLFHYQKMPHQTLSCGTMYTSFDPRAKNLFNLIEIVLLYLLSYLLWQFLSITEIYSKGHVDLL